jgi:hypothetical protein
MLNFLGFMYLAAHLLGDFYFQSNNMSEKKNKYFSHLLIHSLIYTAVVFAVTLPFWRSPFIILNLIFSFTHFFIDLLKFILYKIYKNKSQFTDKYTGHVYIADQALHILSILIISTLFPINENIAAFYSLPFVHITGFYNLVLFRWVCLLLLIGKPVNVTFAKLFSSFKPVRAEIKNNKKTGAAIGVLERIIMVVFMGIQQYSAIGLVLTAKSIARYKMISEDKEFGEYYLLGTFVSLLSAVTAYLILFQHT